MKRVYVLLNWYYDDLWYYFIHYKYKLEACGQAISLELAKEKAEEEYNTLKNNQ